MRGPAAVTAAGIVCLCAACGGTATRTSDRTWRANATELVSQLRQDVTATELVGASRGSAARALGSISDVYTLLVAYSDLSGCSAMASATSAPPPVVRVIARPCARLERAASLFTRAEARSDASLLLRATREAAAAAPALAGVRVYVRGEK